MFTLQDTAMFNERITLILNQFSNANDTAPKFSWEYQWLLSCSPFHYSFESLLTMLLQEIQKVATYVFGHFNVGAKVGWYSFLNIRPLVARIIHVKSPKNWRQTCRKLNGNYFVSYGTTLSLMVSRRVWANWDIV